MNHAPIDRTRFAPPRLSKRRGTHGSPGWRVASAATCCALLLLSGCVTLPALDQGPPLSKPELQALVDAGDWDTLAKSQVDCDDATDDCAKAHASRADACLRLAIQLPVEASATRGQTRRFLDSAEAGYRKALLLQQSSDSPVVASYHGGLLLTLSERRNRLDETVREQKLDRENRKLLEAAALARSEVSDSALGFIYGASALVYEAALKEDDAQRCNDLREAKAMLQQSPPAPRELIEDEERLQDLVARQLRDCNT